MSEKRPAQFFAPPSVMAAALAAFGSEALREWEPTHIPRPMKKKPLKTRRAKAKAARKANLRRMK